MSQYNEGEAGRKWAERVLSGKPSREPEATAVDQAAVRGDVEAQIEAWEVEARLEHEKRQGRSMAARNLASRWAAEGRTSTDQADPVDAEVKRRAAIRKQVEAEIAASERAIAPQRPVPVPGIRSTEVRSLPMQTRSMARVI